MQGKLTKTNGTGSRLDQSMLIYQNAVFSAGTCCIVYALNQLKYFQIALN